LPIVISIFKIVWANTYVVYLAKYGIRSNLPEHVVFLNYTFSLVYMYVLVPIVAVYFTDHDCFFYPAGLGRINPITESYPSIIPSFLCVCENNSGSGECVTIRCDISFLLSPNNDNNQDITPSWTYGYQCGVRILTNYVPAVMSSYTIKGVILPVLKLFLLSFPPDSRIRNHYLVKTVLLPMTVNSMNEVDLSKDKDRDIRTFDYLSNLVTDLLMMFTYGVLCPFLTFLIVWSILVNEFVDHIQLGSYIYDMAGIIDKEEDKTSQVSKGDKVRHQLHQFDLISRIYLDNSRELVMSVWSPMVLVILFFMTLILFDMIADVYDNVAGLVSVLVFWIFISLSFGSGKAGLDKIISFLKKMRTLCDNLVIKIKERKGSTVGAELRTVTDNPLHMKSLESQ
jgi:hypothetical protein